MKNITIDGVEYAPKFEKHERDSMIYAIIRCRDAGVHAGFVKHRDGAEVTLVDSRRLWRWWGETLSGLALNGSFAPEKCKYAPEIPEITLLGVCEIIPCSVSGMTSVREDVGVWKNE